MHRLVSSSKLAVLPTCVLLSQHNDKKTRRGSSPTTPLFLEPNNVVPIVCEDGSTILPWEAPTRASHLAALQARDKVFDVLVIGGGAVGSGCALDATTRGLDVALVEGHDFSSGTSGRSTKLIHGGVRYLEAAFKKLDYSNLALVNEALEEREFMLNAAPYMNQPLPIMIPIYAWWKIPYMFVGTKLYDFIAGSRRSVPKSYFISAEEATFQYPMLNTSDLKGAMVYYDGQMNDTRMNLAIVLTAVQAGAVAVNRVIVTALLKSPAGNTCGAVVKDTLTGKSWDVKAKVVINATGPFADGIREMDDPSVEKMIVPAAGVHVMLPDHFSPDKMGLIVPETSDGRVLFFLPWENATLAGTTDSQSDVTMLPTPTQIEIDFILSEANHHLKVPIQKSDVRAAWSGLRPLVRDFSKPVDSSGTAALSRNHVIEVSTSHLVTVAGGKWTTYRRMAQDGVDAAIKVLTSDTQGDNDGTTTIAPCRTKAIQMVGADRIGEVCGSKFDIITRTLREKYHMDKDVATHLMRNYGTRALQIAEISAAGYLNRKPSSSSQSAVRLVAKYPYLEAEVIFAVRQEYAVKATDVIARRTRLAFIDADATASIVPSIVMTMASLLHWSKARQAAEVAECHVFLSTMCKKEG